MTDDEIIDSYHKAASRADTAYNNAAYTRKRRYVAHKKWDELNAKVRVDDAKSREAKLRVEELRPVYLEAVARQEEAHRQKIARLRAMQ